MSALRSFGVLLFVPLLGFGCQRVHPLALPAARPAVPLSATNPAAYPGLPAAWHRWVGIDPLAEIPTIDWGAHLNGKFAGVLEGLEHAEQACLFEIVHRVRELERRWFVLIAPDAARPKWFKPASMTREQIEEPVSIPLWFSPAKVTVAPAGRAPGPVRSVGLPVVAPRLGYSVGIAEELILEYERRKEADAATDEMLEIYTVTTMKPVVVLLALFLGIQEHQELSSILKEVVDAPGLLGLIFAGGVKMNLNCDTEESRAVQHTLVDGREVPGVVLPASVSVNGDLALELEVFAIESVDPVRLVGGLVGLRAKKPGDGSETVTLRLIGAGVRREETGASRSATVPKEE